MSDDINQEMFEFLNNQNNNEDEKKDHIKRFTYSADIIRNDTDGTLNLGGKETRHTIEDDAIINTEKSILIQGCIGHLMSMNSKNKIFPKYKGQCSICDEGRCEQHLFQCSDKSCSIQICSDCSIEYEKNRYLCRRHYRKYLFRNFIKFMISPFYNKKL